MLEEHDAEAAPIIYDIETRHGKIVIAEVTTIHLCPLNHQLTSVNFETLMKRYKTCAAFCRTKDITTQIQAMLCVKFKSGITKIVLKDPVVCTLLKLDRLTKVLEPDVLVAKLLEKEDIQLKYSGPNILAAAFIEDYKTAVTFDYEDVASDFIL